MKHSLQLKLSQHLTLTPQLQQSIRLLQLSTIELNQELERYLAENPLLERADFEEGASSAPPPTNGSAPEQEAPQQVVHPFYFYYLPGLGCLSDSIEKLLQRPFGLARRSSRCSLWVLRTR